MLAKCGHLLTKDPFTHESLLVDRKEKKLTKYEKRLAERMYAQEKGSKVSYTRPSYAAFYPTKVRRESFVNHVFCQFSKPTWLKS